MKIACFLVVSEGQTRKVADRDLENGAGITDSPIIFLNGNHRRLSSCQVISRKAASEYSEFTSPDLKTWRSRVILDQPLYIQ